MHTITYTMSTHKLLIWTDQSKMYLHMHINLSKHRLRNHNEFGDPGLTQHIMCTANISASTSAVMAQY